MTQPVSSAQHGGPEKAAPAAPASVPPSKGGGPRALGARVDVRNLSLLGVLAVLIAVGGFTEPDAFLDTGNLQLILTQSSVIGVVTVGMTFVITSGGIDLSVGAMVALASVWATTLATQEYGFAGILFTAVLVGLGAGLVNGLLIAYGRMVPFIATLAMLASARGLALLLTDGKTQIVTVQSVLDLGLPDSYILGIPPLVMVFAAATVIGWLVLNRTTFGRRTVAVGGNAEAARLAGIDVTRQRLYLYLLSGLCCGIAAFMLIILSGSGQNTNGNLYELDAIAAAIIGGTLLSGGRGTIVGSVLGVLVFTTITNIFALNNLQSDVQQIAKGAIIVAAVLVQGRTRPTGRPELPPHPIPPHPQFRMPPTHRMKGSTAMPETSRRGLLFGTAAVSAGALLTACTSNEPKKPQTSQTDQPAADNKPGKPVTIGFAGPQADHGWLNAINENAKSQAEKYSEVTLEITEGSNDTAAQIGQVKTLINKKVDVLVILPADGKALTQVGLEAMKAGIPVINLDRIFASPQAYRCWVGGDNYGMGLNAGTYIGEKLKDKPNAKVVELAGIDNLELTKQRSQGFADALENYPNVKLVARQAAEFTVESGQAKMAQLLQAQKKFDALWNHDDDQGVGALRAIQQAGRDEFLMVGGAGAKSAMDAIKADNSVLKATVLYPPTMAASAIDLARALGQGKGIGGLSELEIPTSLTLYSAVVTKDNIDQYLPTGFS